MARKRSTETRRAASQAAAARAAAIRAEQERRERRRRSLVVTAAAVAVLAVVVVVATVVNSTRDGSGTAAAAPAGVVQRYALAVGPTTAPATVTITEDFLCPFCGELEATSHTWLARYAAQGKVRVLYRPISILDSRSDGTEYSTRAANALGVVLDASGPTVAKRFHDLLYASQPEENTPGLSDAKLLSLAVQAGATESAVRPGITKAGYEQWVADATDAGESQKGYRGTPFVQLDGKPFTDYTTVEELSGNLRKAVDAAGG
jgi:protein-disulfide isomerase